MYCSRACKSQEEALRSAEAGALGKVEGISFARDIDLDLLRMMLRLVIMRATALGLRPESTQEVDAGGAGEGQELEEAGAGGEVRCFCGGHLNKKNKTIKEGRKNGGNGRMNRAINREGGGCKRGKQLVGQTRKTKKNTTAISTKVSSVSRGDAATVAVQY